jgi:hypothetical protein
VSQWGSIDAEFRGEHVSLELIAGEFEDREAPTGSEDGPAISEHGGTVYVDGRLRDVSDEEDSFAVLAWFTKHCHWADEATLLWDLDRGPKYRYRYTREGGMERTKGVLDL